MDKTEKCNMKPIWRNAHFLQGGRFFNIVQAAAHTLMMREVLPAETSRIYSCWQSCPRAERAGTRRVSLECSKVDPSVFGKKTAVDSFTNGALHRRA